MNYLNREQRRKMILDAAKRLALQDGLNGLTVRRIASEAQVSTGQVHHHFESSSHLKAEVFIALMDQLDEVENLITTESSVERLCLLLGIENIEQTQPYLRLWNEAEVLIDQDQEIKKAYNIAMEKWHLALVTTIEYGRGQQEFKISTSSSSQDIAWRLIAFVCGLEGIYELGLKGLDNHSFKHHVELVLKMELF
ncbi:TetR family transcriptional regulator [Acinetobacter bereziniae]|uniref:TetR family transcriptional regulator n=1 Tax=Acinetobacter bereziniae TaxID=106648 RepID=A0A8I1AFB7_ACIBZ|nr:MULTISPECIES: TetR family transcriptional regulator [Acinetobacter]MEC8123421.1 TetR family transcriptional regulator [Pseudomonadota bacterium]MBJ8420664.1 TetR family transcriptional regulator [Acinetobacter bereziniae]MBJ9951221.1 TetR family transcriptional regulator [Acinetobacter bereziniae]MCU4476426.1 TetR family transcriptional regulator [Acinetobacter bereziniae]MDQ9818107.1 TetR family transcriptional regulator [Acinetobacter bereziniae]